MARYVGALALALALPSVAAGETLLLISAGGGNAGRDALEAARARLADEEEVDVIVAEANLEDTALLLGCELESDECLDAIAASVQADAIAAIDVKHGDLRLRRDGETQRRELASRDVAVELAEMLGLGEEPEPEPIVEPPPQEEPEAAEESVVVAPQERSEALAPPLLSRVQARSWWIIGGGAATTTLGLVLLSVASQKQDDVDAHPTESAADLESLRSLEASGQRFTTAGNLFAIGGGITLAAGIGFAFWDVKTRRAPSVRPSASSDRLLLSLEWTL